MAARHTHANGRLTVLWALGGVVLTAVLTYGLKDLLDSAKGQIRAEGDIKLLNERVSTLNDRLRAVSDRMNIMDERIVQLRAEVAARGKR